MELHWKTGEILRKGEKTMIEYIKLLDKLNKDMIVKTDGIDHYRYIFGLNIWISTAVMLDYFSEESVFYGQYEEIEEQQAMKLLEMQREKYLTMHQEALELAENCNEKNEALYNFIKNNGGFKDIETNITALLYSINFLPKTRSEYTERILCSLSILKNSKVLPEKEYLNKIYLDYNAQKIKKWEISELYKKGEISQDSYEHIIGVLAGHEISI